MPEYLTKREWLKALIEGSVGVQSGNGEQRWRYNKDEGYFESKHLNCWKLNTIENLYTTNRDFYIVEEIEMSIADIERALGVINLKVVK